MYKNPEALNSEKHGHLNYHETADHRFAQAETAVPLVAEEIALASAHYPIVFPEQGSAQPLALLGFTGRNRWVDDEGRWAKAYIPAGIRRYPFVFAKNETDPDTLHLALDRDAPHFVGEGQPLFDKGGEVGILTKAAMDFVTAYQKGIQRTLASHQPLIDAGLIVTRYLSVDNDGATKVIGSFGAVDEEKFKALPDETLAAWARSGLLATVYAHWASLRHLDALAAAEMRPEVSN